MLNFRRYPLECKGVATIVGRRSILSSLTQRFRVDSADGPRRASAAKNILLQKQENQFVLLVDDAIKRAIGKSKVGASLYLWSSYIPLEVSRTLVPALRMLRGLTGFV